MSRRCAKYVLGAVGVDPLLIYLVKPLSGIPITSLPVLGPTQKDADIVKLPPLQQGSSLCLGVKVHRDPAAGKVKFLALARWRGTLTQEDIPHQYKRIV